MRLAAKPEFQTIRIFMKEREQEGSCSRYDSGGYMKTIHISILACILILSACGAPASAPTVEFESTAPLLPTLSFLPTFTPSPRPFPTATPEATFTPVGMEKPTDFSPVVYGGKFYQTPFFLLLGGVSREKWLVPEESVARFSGEANYSLHTLLQENKYMFRGTSPEFFPTSQSYSIHTNADINEVGLVGVLDGWPITKRAVTELSADGQFYQQSVIDWLTSEGVSTPQLDVLHVFRVDIEGDGVDEIFISASHLDESQHTTKADDYSVVLMRKVEGNAAVTVPIVGDVYRSQELEITYPTTYSLINFIDLNQDGVLEVIVDTQKWENVGAIIYQINGQDVIQALP